MPRKLLPTNVRPLRYDLELRVDVVECVFSGQVAIHVDICSGSTIELHSLETDLGAVQLVCEGDAAELVPTVSTCREDETVTLHFAQPLPTGAATLTMAFAGALKDNLVGLYRSAYPAKEDEATRYMAVTQFEATDARRCFPCFDEPALKAIFNVTVQHDASLTSLSNMPVEKEEVVSDGQKRVTFAASPVMSTYLLALLVGEFDHIEATTQAGVTVRCYTTPGMAHQAKFALDVAVRSLDYFSEYFATPYPLRKLDMAAICDFAAGAMENWGLVTYREVAILVDEENTSAHTRQDVAVTVAHELAHQWFGNLVTMEWWTDLWLNEAFATWVSYLAVQELFPEWEPWTQFVVDDFMAGMSLDALQNSHPIEVEVSTAGEVNEIFDAISYCKGSAVIRMLVEYVTEEVFRDGMQVYLRRHAYGNARTEHLWAALEEQSGKPVGAVMETYTKHANFPVVQVSECDDGSLRLRQELFLADGVRSDDDRRWWIPVTMLVGNVDGTTKRVQCPLSEREAVVAATDLQGAAWIKVNASTAGFYRVHYPATMLERLMPAVRAQCMPATDRLGLVSDAFALAKAGAASTVDALRLVHHYADEREFCVWDEIASWLNRVGSTWAHEACYDNFAAFVRGIVSPLAATMPWDASLAGDHLRSMLRNTLLGLALHFEEPSAVAKALELFRARQTTSIHSDLRGLVYHATASHGTSDDYDALMAIAMDAPLQEERVRALGALGSTRDTSRFGSLLEMSIDSTRVRTQDATRVYGSLSGNRAAAGCVWDYLTSHWSTFETRFADGNMNMIGRFISTSTRGFTSTADAERVAAFFANKKVPSAERTIQQCIEGIRARAAWKTRDNDALATFLKSE